MAKVDATRHYGADVVSTAPRSRRRSTPAARTSRPTARRSCIRSRSGRDRGPGDDRSRARGPGREIETVVIPIGGGGLASGIALALRAVKPGVRIVGVQAEETLPGGSGYTIADGIAVKKPGELTMPILERRARRHRLGRGRGDQRRTRRPARADEARRRRCRRSQRRGGARRQGRRQRAASCPCSPAGTSTRPCSSRSCDTASPAPAASSSCARAFPIVPES